MDRKVKKYLADILETNDSIYYYFGGDIYYNLFLQNKNFRLAVEWEMEIIGEAMNRTI